MRRSTFIPPQCYDPSIMPDVAVYLFAITAALVAVAKVHGFDPATVIAEFDLLTSFGPVSIALSMNVSLRVRDTHPCIMRVKGWWVSCLASCLSCQIRQSCQQTLA